MRILLNGEPMEVEEGTSVAAALLNAGVSRFRESASGEPRGPLCGMGICYECRAMVDGVDHERTCLMACREGMEVSTSGEGRGSRAEGRGSGVGGRGSREELSCDVLVVGAGPAGLAAAVAASRSYATVIVLDENPDVGGQIWRRETKSRPAKGTGLLARSLRPSVRTFTSTRVFDITDDQYAWALGPNGVTRVHFQKAILACGARELFLPFPGWTLPGVVGVGGMQALIKQGWAVAGKRVVVAGTGPLILSAARYARRARARSVMTFDQAPKDRHSHFARELWRYPSKLVESSGYVSEFLRMAKGWWVNQAIGETALRAVEVTNGRESRTIEADVLSIGYGLVPNVELAKLAGCEIDNGFVVVDGDQRSTVPNLFCVGEMTGIGGAELSVSEGFIAGSAAAGQEASARFNRSDREKYQAFAHLLAKTYELRPDVLSLAREETLMCRCEDVRFGDLSGKSSFRGAKLHTRLGMGPCQGRVCAAACRAMLGWEEPSVRPPIVPVPLSALLQETEESSKAAP